MKQDRPRIAVFGDIVLDIIVVHREEVARDSDSRAGITPAAGGSAANVAAWAARCGAEVAFFGQAGDDVVGRQLKAELAAEGVGVDPPAGNLRLTPDAPTGIIIVNVETGSEGPHRTMVTDRGANLTVPLDIVPPEALGGRDWFHVTGYSFFEPRPRRAALQALEHCRNLGLPFSVDPSSYRLLEEYGPLRLLNDIAGAAALLPNRDEALTLAGVDDPRRAVSILARRFPLVLVKLGDGGCLVAGGGETVAVPAVTPEGPVVDPTGAGDAFAAGFLCAWARDRGTQGPRGVNLEAAVAAAREASAVAAQAVVTVGGRPPRRRKLPG